MIKKILIGILFLPVVLEASWYFLPNQWVEQKIESTLGSIIAHRRITADIHSLKKGLPFRFSVENISLTRQDHPLISMEEVSGSINPLSILSSYISINARGEVSDGVLDSVMDIAPEGVLLNFHIEDLDIERLPLSGLLGINGRGKLRGRGSIYISLYNRELKRFNYVGSVEDILLKDISIGGDIIPLSLFESSLFTVRLKRKDYFLMKGILKGDGVTGFFNVKIEGFKLSGFIDIITEEDYKKKEKLARISDFAGDNYYYIPFKGNISKLFKKKIFYPQIGD
ncbi:MAG: hypothetical protein GXO97_02020 [Nitrospirae bacterium]|nr:hypothetical protein [Nitrospirota bacterium]